VVWAFKGVSWSGLKDRHHRVCAPLRRVENRLVVAQQRCPPRPKARARWRKRRDALGAEHAKVFAQAAACQHDQHPLEIHDGQRPDGARAGRAVAVAVIDRQRFFAPAAGADRGHVRQAGKALTETVDLRHRMQQVLLAKRRQGCRHLGQYRVGRTGQRRVAHLPYFGQAECQRFDLDAAERVRAKRAVVDQRVAKTALAADLGATRAQGLDVAIDRAHRDAGVLRGQRYCVL
jgi:hypothetical protein